MGGLGGGEFTCLNLQLFRKLLAYFPPHFFIIFPHVCVGFQNMVPFQKVNIITVKKNMCI